MKISYSIDRSADFGKLKFPTRQDYIKYFLENKIVSHEHEIWNDETLVSIIHRHWHGEGRNGCIFALLAAKRSAELGWSDYVITDNINEIGNNLHLNNLISSKIEQAIHDPDCEILSLLFSKIINYEDLAKLIQYLLSMDNFILIKEEVVNKKIVLALRVPLNKDGVLSWVMAFGSFASFPLTRQSPITEIAIRVKPKPEAIFKRLSKDTDAAHLADLPLDYHDEVMEKIWQNTLKRTRYILGEEPNEFSAAKTTFTLPKGVWFNVKEDM